MDEDDLRFYLTRNVSKREISNLDSWVKADGCSLSEGIFLIEGKEPSDILETIRGAQEYKQEYQNYCLAERSIKSGKLNAQKTDKGYWVDIDDLLNWAIDKEIGNLKILDTLISKRQDIKIDRLKEDIELAYSNKQVSEKAQVLLSSQKIKNILGKIIQARQCSIDLALQEKFSGSDERSQHLGLITKFGAQIESDFSKYAKGPIPPSLIVEHKCRALALLIRFFEPEIKISEIYTHPLMKYGGFMNKKFTPKTFRQWLYKENIFDYSVRHNSKKLNSPS